MVDKEGEVIMYCIPGRLILLLSACQNHTSTANLISLLPSALISNPTCTPYPSSTVLVNSQFPIYSLYLLAVAYVILISTGEFFTL